MKKETNRPGNRGLISVLSLAISFWGIIISACFGKWIVTGIFLIFFTIGNVVFIREIDYGIKKTILNAFAVELVPIFPCIVIALISAII